MLMNKSGMSNPVVLLLVAIVGGTLIGWVNGMLLTRLHLPHPFVSTLGMKNVLWGRRADRYQLSDGYPSPAMTLLWIGCGSCSPP